jgi:EspG family
VRVISRDISISGEWLRLGAEAAGIPLPGVLTAEAMWRDPGEQRAQVNQAIDALAAEGLWRGRGPTEEFAATLTVLGRGARELLAVVEQPGLGYRVQISASGNDAVLVCYVPTTGRAFLRPARSGALAEDLVAQLPEASPGEGVALSVPESDLRQAINGAPPRRDIRRVLDVVSLPRTGGGQIYAGFRDGRGAYRQTGNSCCTFYDTDRGRYVFSFTEERGYERYVNVAQGRPDVLVTKAYELLDQLQRVRQRR